ncbi:energy transducer TonB [Pontibacter sp. KCTC 32443]|uniref:energy transducer TonB n=1 Tax=Pontibacter TaxID=323449 RepID=UPI00164D9F11|nr:MULTISPECIES: energy transducer TonB [Pontibacter]MBC5775982.1 energy transducer TonB [Pontibacter sp. KCTC 32443]
MKITYSIIALTITGVILSITLATGGINSKNYSRQEKEPFAADTVIKKGPLVIATFVVNEIGKVGSINIKKVECDFCSKKVKAELSEAVIKALKESPDWQPGIQNGQPVKVLYTLPIRFIVEGDSLKMPSLKSN